jgi:hypothetical protein
MVRVVLSFIGFEWLLGVRGCVFVLPVLLAVVQLPAPGSAGASAW